MILKREIEKRVRNSLDLLLFVLLQFHQGRGRAHLNIERASAALGGVITPEAASQPSLPSSPPPSSPPLLLSSSFTALPIIRAMLAIVCTALRTCESLGLGPPWFAFQNVCLLAKHDWISCASSAWPCLCIGVMASTCLLLQRQKG